MAQWIFKQLKGDLNNLTLDGWDAPFGRPRKEPVVKEGLNIRMSENYYAGSSVPTRHIFGKKYENFEINGRFRDKVPGHGSGYAKNKSKEVKDFVNQQQLCSIIWPGVVHVEGIISNFSTEIESPGEIVWRMTIKIDKDNLSNSTTTKPKATTPANHSNKINQFFKTAFDNVKKIPKLKGNLLDLLDSIVSLVTTVAGQLTSITDQIASFESATFGELGRLISVLGTMRQLCIQLKDLFLDVPIELQSLSQRADDQIYLLITKSFSDTSILSILEEMANFESDIEQARAGRLRTTYIALQGDTWESISIKFYNTSDRAKDLKDANDGIEKPIVGVEYFIVQ
jgi:hypothetical protein